MKKTIFVVILLAVVTRYHDEKKYFGVLMIFATAILGFAQGFDDMPYSNPDMPTYFQQEMTSLMRFQADHSMNIPFFVSFSGRHILMGDDNISSLYAQFSDSHADEEGINRGIHEINALAGVQFKLSDTFYLPALFCIGVPVAGYHYIREITYKGETVQEPLFVVSGSPAGFLGSGLFINTDIVKGGIYMGWGFVSSVYSTSSPSLEAFMKENEIYTDTDREADISTLTHSFKIALVPLVNTSEWAVIGKVLDNILGYLGLGDAVMSFADEKGDSKAAAFANALNAALDFTFNRIVWGPLFLDAQVMYNRGNFDAAAKADTYGAKVTGLFSSFPFGFTLESGYKHFSSVYDSQYFMQGYNNGTGYFNGSAYFPLKHITLGLLYKYDRIYQSRFGIAVSNNTFSGLGLLGLNNISEILGEWGLRFRWGGWKASAQ